jgi:hypothetical protein
MRIKPDQLTDIGDFVITRCPPRVGKGKPVRCRPDPFTIQAPKVNASGQRARGFELTMTISTFDSRGGVNASDVALNYRKGK